jgi:hypothetical protein
MLVLLDWWSTEGTMPSSGVEKISEAKLRNTTGKCCYKKFLARILVQHSIPKII